MHSLPVFLRVTGRPVILVGTGEAAEAKRRLLERAGACLTGEEGIAALAIIACEDNEEREAAASRLRTRGVLLNVVDRPDLCDFTMPAIVDRDPVIVAIGTGGASAGLAKAVRQRLERLLPPSLGALANALDLSRLAIKARWPDARSRRGALDAALAEGGALDPFRIVEPDAIAQWLVEPDLPAAGRCETVVLTSGDPDDLTLRAARLLGEADLVLHDAAVPATILDRARADAVRCVIGLAEPVSASGKLTVILNITSL